MLMNRKLLSALKLTKTLRRTVLVYTLNLFRLAIVLKLISDCLRFSGFFRWSIWVVSENPMVTLITTMTSRNTLPLVKYANATAARSLGNIHRI